MYKVHVLILNHVVDNHALFQSTIYVNAIRRYTFIWGRPVERWNAWLMHPLIWYMARYIAEITFQQIMTAPINIQDTPRIMNANWNALPTDISEENQTSIVW